MEIVTGSKQLWRSTLNWATSGKNNSGIINGFKGSHKEFSTYTQKCQYFLSPYFDIFIYHLDTKKSLEIYLQSVSCKWLLFYIVTGKINQLCIKENNFDFFDKSSFFASIQEGESIKMCIEKGKHLFICCNLKSAYETILLSYYASLFNECIKNPIIINTLNIRDQYEWEKLLESIDVIDLIPSKLNAQVQEILSNFCFTYKSRKMIIDQTVFEPTVQKIYELKNLIDCYPFKRHTLNSLAVQTNLNVRLMSINFKLLFKKSVFQYCIEKRMDYATYLLENHFDTSIKNVAICCGFKKPQHFIRQFQQKYGVSPGNYKKSIMKTT